MKSEEFFLKIRVKATAFAVCAEVAFSVMNTIKTVDNKGEI